MTLPIIGGGPPGRPPRPPTHTPIPMDRLMRLAGDLQDAAEDQDCETLTGSFMDEVAEDLGVPTSHLYVAAAMMTELPFASGEPVRFEVCIAGCQGWGAVDTLDALIELQRQRAESDKRGFDVTARGCLEQCAGAPAVRLHTPDGVALVTEAGNGSLHEAIATAFGEE